MRFPKIRRRGRHEKGHGRHEDRRGGWTPGPADWERLAAGETVHGYRVERAPSRTRRRDPNADPYESIGRRPFRQGESLASRIGRVPRSLWWKDKPGRGAAPRPAAPLPHSGQRNQATGMWRR